jgi:dipeptidyl-peptidase-3
VVRLIRGDHAEELTNFCACLAEAAKFAASPRQRTIISKYCESFKSGDLHVYRESQREWIADRAPRVENIFGFVEPYRDPQGIRAEWEALVAIPNAEETVLLTRLVKNSKTFIRRFPWAKGATENDGQGPFEKEAFDPPDFSSIHDTNQQVLVLPSY